MKELLTLEILHMSTEERNRCFSYFILDFKKTDNSECPPDLIFYIALGIQEHLYMNGCYENIFVDECYEKFIESFDRLAKKFNSMRNDGSE